MRLSSRSLLAAALSLVALGTAACGSADSPAQAAPGPTTLRLGYFPNLTHAPALIGVQDGSFARALGEDVTLTSSTFNSGTQAVEALFSGAVDATFIGPSPAINAYVKSRGEAIRLVAGTTSGGASLVVREGIDTPAQLAGTKLATPGLGNTQDVALRSWLASQGLSADTAGGGAVSVVPQENAQTLDLFTRGEIDGAWLPEPWATRLVQQGKGHVLLDEATLWPQGQWATTQLAVAPAFLRDHPDVVKALLGALVDVEDAIAADPAAAQRSANDGIEAVTGKRLPDAVLAAAFPRLTFTVDPLAATLRRQAAAAVALGQLPSADVTDLYDLTLLNEVLTARGRPAVRS